MNQKEKQSIQRRIVRLEDRLARLEFLSKRNGSGIIGRFLGKDPIAAEVKRRKLELDYLKSRIV